MVVKFKKPEDKTPQAQVPLAAYAEHEEDAITKLIEEMGALERKVKDFKPTADRLAAVKKALQEHYDSTLSADQAFEQESEHFLLEVSAKGNQRTVTSAAKVCALLGDEKFLAVATVPLKAIDDYMTPEEKAEVLKEERTGSRTLKLKPKV